MANVSLSHIYKVYPNGMKAVSDFCMDIEDKEFIVFVGPSGCGKSTTLRMIAGLEEITAGELKIGDSIMNDVDPKDRDIAMVFQNYALYPHMTVYDNMAFGLKLRKMPKAEIDKRVKEAAEILGITEYLKKKPKEMSGGQRQRVALGRAIVREPKVFLLDEPLSNLDAKLRTAMRAEISKLHKKLKTTFIYVTHDQIEAMTMGTRIVVMKAGFIQQIDTPRNLYNYPCNKFVAGFIGTPQMNFFEGTLKAEGESIHLKLTNTNVDLEIPASYLLKLKPGYTDGTKPVIIGLRAEHISANADLFPFKAKCKVSHYEDLGTDCQVYANFNTEDTEALSGNSTTVVLKAPAGSYYESDDIIEVSLALDHMHLFDAETEKSILPRIPEETIVSASIAGGKLNILGGEISVPAAINTADGEYTVTVPSDALCICDNGISAVYEGEENVNGKRLVRVTAGGTTLFIVTEDKETAYKAGAKIHVAVDIKKLTICNAETTISPLPLVNTLQGTLSTEVNVVSVQNEKGKTVKAKDVIIHYNIGEEVLNCSDAVIVKLLGNSKLKATDVMLYSFSPYAVSLGESKIKATVESILDYGDEKFAICKCGDVSICVATNDAVVGSEVGLVIDVNAISVYDDTLHLQLI